MNCCVGFVSRGIDGKYRLKEGMSVGGDLVAKKWLRR